ncbi:MAG: M3 family oligoendopeptidase, partial [Firmicutes bacterium]|nr:M3 family oligoendopeptidase [Bacillota bacterium]
MLKNLEQRWDLDVFFPGGSKSPQFAEFLQSLEQDLQKAAQVVADLGESLPDWLTAINLVQDLGKRLRHASAFVACLNAQNVKDTDAQVLTGRVQQLNAANASVLTSLDEKISALPEEKWNQLLAEPELGPIAFNLQERRLRASQMLPPEQEKLVNSLSVNGYHGWSQLYNLVAGNLVIPVEHEGKTLHLSAGQAANWMSHADRNVRQHVFERWEQAWASIADSCALALNNLAGYRLNLYAARRWENVLQEPMEQNRMRLETLEAMWSAVESRRPRLVQYLERKRELLGLPGLSWHDVNAPLGSSDTRLTYDQAAAFIVDQFDKFDPEMAQIAIKAFKERWIESEDRPGKRAGGFCTSFPVAKQSRIFVTFSGTMGNLATLAHELGHCYHQHLMNELPPMAQRYAMNVAETASTFAELITMDAAADAATDEKERLSLIDDKMQRAVALLMNIQCRFLFETRFYEERKQGMVSVSRLNELMVEAQKEAFADSLSEYHPHFWASKLHFYNTNVPFYNFPYTFG